MMDESQGFCENEIFYIWPSTSLFGMMSRYVIDFCRFVT